MQKITNQRGEAYRKQINTLAKLVRAELTALTSTGAQDASLTAALADLSMIMSPVTGRISGIAAMRVLAQVGRVITTSDTLASHGRLLTDSVVQYLRGGVTAEHVADLTAQVQQASRMARLDKPKEGQ